MNFSGDHRSIYTYFSTLRRRWFRDRRRYSRQIFL